MEKPTITVDLSGEQGNIFTLMSEARAAILSDVRRLGFQTQKSREEQDRDKAHAEFVAGQMMREVMQTHTYNGALAVIRRYVNIEQKGGGLWSNRYGVATGNEQRNGKDWLLFGDKHRGSSPRPPAIPFLR